MEFLESIDEKKFLSPSKGKGVDCALFALLHVFVCGTGCLCLHVATECECVTF